MASLTLTPAAPWHAAQTVATLALPASMSAAMLAGAAASRTDRAICFFIVDSPGVVMDGKPKVERVYSTCARFVAALGALILAGCASVTVVPVTAIVGATVVHLDRDGATADDQTLVIEGNRIARVGPASTTPVPPGATRIDGPGKWVVPGLADAHVHFFQSGN